MWSCFVPDQALITVLLDNILISNSPDNA